MTLNPSLVVELEERGTGLNRAMIVRSIGFTVDEPCLNPVLFLGEQEPRESLDRLLVAGAQSSKNGNNSPLAQVLDWISERVEDPSDAKKLRAVGAEPGGESIQAIDAGSGPASALYIAQIGAADLCTVGELSLADFLFGSLRSNPLAELIACDSGHLTGTARSRGFGSGSRVHRRAPSLSVCSAGARIEGAIRRS